MEKLFLFVDGSVNPQQKVGYGAFLLLNNVEVDLKIVRDQVVLQRFEETSSTKLELQNLLGALERLDVDGKELIVYTDSQNIVGLLGRRERFERNDYRTKKREKIANHELYKLFFQWMDRLSCTLIKVEGHKVSDQKDRIDELFTLVDRASRDKLRADI